MKIWKSILFTTLLSCGAVAAPVELDKVAVIVNDGVILQSDIDTALKTLQANARQSGKSLPSAQVLHDQVVEKLILDTLQGQEADRIGVRIDDSRLNQAIAEIARNNNQSVEQLTASIASEGLSYTEFREQIRKEIAASEARNALVRRRVNILPAEVDSLSEQLSQETNATVQYKISHIQLRFSDDQEKSAVEAEAKALVKNSMTALISLKWLTPTLKGQKPCKVVTGAGCAKRKCQPSLPTKSICRTKAASSVHSAVVLGSIS